jgi:hypothetical protein
MLQTISNAWAVNLTDASKLFADEMCALETAEKRLNTNDLVRLDRNGLVYIAKSQHQRRNACICDVRVRVANTSAMYRRRVLPLIVMRASVT